MPRTGGLPPFSALDRPFHESLLEGLVLLTRGGTRGIAWGRLGGQQGQGWPGHGPRGKLYRRQVEKRGFHMSRAKDPHLGCFCFR